MIDHTLVISPAAALIFHLKQGFFLYAWPMFIGFLTILGYQTMGRVAMSTWTLVKICNGWGMRTSMRSCGSWLT